MNYTYLYFLESANRNPEVGDLARARISVARANLQQAPTWSTVYSSCGKDVSTFQERIREDCSLFLLCNHFFKFIHIMLFND